jgi:hypothetical protein
MAIVYAATANPALVADGFTHTTLTFSAQAIGAAAADRQVIVGVFNTNGVAISSVTIGGVTATNDISETTTHAGIFRASVPTGTTADVVITCSSTFDHLGIVVATMTGASSGAASATAVTNQGAEGEPINVTATVPTSGLGVVVCGSGGTSASPSWTNATGDFNTGDGTRSLLLAHTTTAGSDNPQLSASGAPYAFISSMVMATYAPAASGDTLQGGSQLRMM